MQTPVGALGCACPLFQAGFVQELGVPARRELGHLHIRSCWEEMRNLHKALPHHQALLGAWEQNMGVSLLFREQQGGTRSCELTTEQRVLPFCSSQQILNKVQLRLGLQGLMPPGEQRDPKLLS